MSSFQACPGRTPVSDVTRLWYVPNGLTSRDCTFCQSCFEQHVKNSSNSSLNFAVTNNLINCTCDFVRSSEDVRVSIVEQRTRRPFQLVENETAANKNNVFHFNLPTCVHYSILIENVKGGNFYLTLEEARVGDQVVEVNNGEKIYYKKEIMLNGYRTGANSSFFFVSPTKDQSNRVPNLNESNIIHLKVKVHVKKEQQSRGFYMDEYDSCGFSLQSAGGFSFEGGESFKKTKGDNFCGTFSNNNFSGGATFEDKSLFNGYVQTKTTDAKFFCVSDTLDFTVQLVCNQSDDLKQKVNEDYFRKLDIAKRDQIFTDIRDKRTRLNNIEREIKSLQEQEKLLRETISEKERELKNYTDNDLPNTDRPNKGDFLFTFK